MIDRATIDYETRSACSIKNCGSWRYSLDPTTEILCLAWRLPYWDEGRTGLWHPAFPHLDLTEAEAGGPTADEDLAELFAWIMAGGIVEAHSAFFERGIWVNLCEPMGWPLIHPHQWRCSAAKAASHALPRALEDATTALRLPIEKDTEGHKLMLKMCKPRKPTKADWIAWNRQHAPCPTCTGTGKVDAFKKDGSLAAKQKKCGTCAGTGARNTTDVPPMPLLYHETREDMLRLFAYCRTDILAEEGLSHRLDDLVPDESNIYMIDQVINERGFRLDREAITVALELIDEESIELNAELRVLTGGAVERATQRDRMIAWFETQGLKLADTRKDTIADLLNMEEDAEAPPWADQPPTGPVRRALELMKMLGRSSTAKYLSMRDWICPDDRSHGSLLYHGASTGRWTGKGVQPHNFVRGEIADMDAAWEALKSKDRARIAAITNKDGEPIGSVMDVLAHALRGAIVASPGKELFVSDFAGIEARVLLWVAGDDDGLDIFREGRDIYCEMASDIYQRPISKKTDPEERQLGKAAILGLGFQMGAPKFVATAATYGITISEELSQQVVDTYRTKFWRVKQLWYDQEEAAKRAVKSGRRIECGATAWFVENGFLFCELPSGRRLAYAEPEIQPRMTSWGAIKETLTFMGIDPHTRQWKRQTTYGGSLVENIVQAIARDLMAGATWRCELSGTYLPVLTVHDEIIGEAESGQGDIKAFEAMMAELPEWAEGLPVACEGFKCTRYRK